MLAIARLFRRKKQPPLVCAVALDDNGHPLMDDPSHVHTAACFVEFAPMALLELFQSQGCASCPPAVPAIQSSAAQANRLLLTLDVTIFDHTGWKDTFARVAWDQRQRAYLRRWKRTTLCTPHVVVNGVVDTSAGGSELDDAVNRSREAIQAAMPWHIVLDANDTEVRIDSDAPLRSAAVPDLMSMHTATDPDGMAPAMSEGMAMPPNSNVPPMPTYDVMLAVYHAGDQTVKIGKGPNKGKKLVHRNVVTHQAKIGEWRGGNLTLDLPSPRSAMAAGLEAVVYVQEGAGGPIVAVTRV